MRRGEKRDKVSAAEAGNTTPARVLLANQMPGSTQSLLAYLEDCARHSSLPGKPRRLVVITCYFDRAALKRAAAALSAGVRSSDGTISELMVAVDVGEWVRRRVSRMRLQTQLAEAAGIDPSMVTVVPVQFTGRLLHAKAYAALRVEGKVVSGFAVVTSGNATGRGMGIDPKSNAELAARISDRQGLLEFNAMVSRLATKSPSTETLVRQSRFLRALALFSRGRFYHRWQGSLSSETRFSFLLTEAGKAAARGDADAFPGYDSDAETKSRDPIMIERVFHRRPRALPRSFWKVYAVETVMGHWLPDAIARLVDERVADTAEGYVNAVAQHLSDERVTKAADELKKEMERFQANGWTKAGPRLVDTWQKRVVRLRTDHALIRLRVHPYEQVPQLLNSETRSAVLQAALSLEQRLAGKATTGTRRVVKAYLDKSLTLAELDASLAGLAEDASRLLTTRRTGRH